MKSLIAFLAVAFISVTAPAAEPAGITSQSFGKTADGVNVEIYTLRNASGMEARIMNYGGTVVSLKVPDKAGTLADVVLGYDKLEDYLATRSYFSALIGRYANRIASGQFDLEGKHYQLPLNSGSNTLHGGPTGFDNVLWTPKSLTTKEGPALELTYVSKDGEDNFPGTLTVTATYTLTDKNELKLEYTATTDKTTVVNFTHHSYFNLAGQGEGDILGNEVTINADKFVAVTPARVPSGELRSVEGTPLDFRKSTTVGARVDSDYEQMVISKGYDHCWVLNKKPGELTLAAKVVEPKSGRILEVLTTEPGVQLYSANGMHDTENMKGGKSYHAHYGLAIEPGHFPDSVNHPDFPTTVLKPGDTYKSTIIFRFSAQ